MKTKKVKIFTEGGSDIGLGHISRCSSLFDEVESKGIEVEFIIYGHIENVNFLNGRTVKNVEWLSEDYLNNNIQNADYCIIDSYLASKELYEIISNKSKKSLFIDDTARIEYPKGIIVNPALSVDDLNYLKNDENTYLLGAKYIILRRPFAGVYRDVINKDVKKVLITMGGSDLGNLTPIILNEICRKYPKINFDVVILNTFHNINQIERIKLNNVELQHNIDAELMKELMLESDFTITAAGQTIYELLATQTPFIPIKVAENQSNNIKGLKKINPNQVVMEYEDELLLERLEIEFTKMLNIENRKIFTQQYENRIDGFGSKRITDILLAD